MGLRQAEFVADVIESAIGLHDFVADGIEFVADGTTKYFFVIFSMLHTPFKFVTESHEFC